MRDPHDEGKERYLEMNQRCVVALCAGSLFFAASCDADISPEVIGEANADPGGSHGDLELEDVAEPSAAALLGTWEIDADADPQGDGPDGLDHIYNVGGERVTLNTSNYQYNPQTQQFDTPVEGSIKFQVNSAGQYIQIMTDVAKFVFHEAVKINERLELGHEDVYGKQRLLVDGSALIGSQQPYLDGQGNLTPDALPNPYNYKLWVRGGPAFFNGLPPESGNGGQLWNTSVVIAANDGLTKPTDEDPNREMRLLGGGPYSTGLYGAGLSWGLAPRPGSAWRPGAWSSQQFLFGYWGDFLWLRGQEKQPGGNPAGHDFDDSQLRDLVRFSANSAYHPLAVFGNVWAHGFIQSSDERLKRDVKTLDGALDKVLSLRGTSYEYDSERRPDLNLPGGPQIGFVAQEVQKVLPWLVKGDGTGVFAVSYDGFVPLLVEAMKEQNQAISAQHAMDSAQRRELDELRGELDRMRGEIGELRQACAGSEPVLAGT